MGGMDELTPSAFGKLVETVVARAPRADSTAHGEAHWRAVAWTALELAGEVAGADPVVGLLFGLLHDSQRIDDGHDPEHGPRAAAFTRELARAGLLPVEEARLVVLCRAIAEHTTARPTDDPTLGVCYDADRLNLWRIGVRPYERFLSTEPAKRREVIELHRRLPGQRATWEELAARALG